MVEFPFDATTGKTKWRSRFEDPHDFAKYMWSTLGKEPVLSSLEEACDWAKDDRDAYDRLWSWAIENKEKLNNKARLMVFESLIISPPKANTQIDFKKIRDKRLAAIANVLVEEYGLTKGQNIATNNKGRVVFVGSVLAKLPGVTLSDRHITKAIDRVRTKGA